VRLFDAVIVTAATLRLTRLVVVDDVGRWWIKEPAERWVERGEMPAWTAEGEPLTKRAKLVTGLDCPFCVGFWIGAVVLAGHRLPGARVVLLPLALNEVVGHLAARLGDTVSSD